MKRSEFAEIVNTVAHEQYERLNSEIQEQANSDEYALQKMIAHIASSIPAISARTTADILVRSGLVLLEDE